MPFCTFVTPIKIRSIHLKGHMMSSALAHVDEQDIGAAGLVSEQLAHRRWLPRKLCSQGAEQCDEGVPVALSPEGPGGGRGAGQPEHFVCVGPAARVGTESGDGHGGSLQWLERSSSQPCTLARAYRSPNAGVADSERARHHRRDFETPERHRPGMWFSHPFSGLPH